MLNSDQKGHLDYLATVDPAKRCWCGWAERGRCVGINLKCQEGLSLADRHKAEKRGA